MQDITIKLNYDECDALALTLQLLFENTDEGRLVTKKQYQTLFILASLKDFYIKLVKTTAVPFDRAKSFKLKPSESLALHSLTAFSMVSPPIGSWFSLFLQQMSDYLHQNAVCAGSYLRIPDRRRISNTTETIKLLQ